MRTADSKGNTGFDNTGYANTGDRNTGFFNAGNGNSGDWNSGYRCTGNWNSGDWNTGHFNADTPEVIRVFGKECSRQRWDEAYKPMFLFFNLGERSDGSTTDSEYSYKDAFRRSWDEADPADRMLIKDLPNFDAEIFYQISGIDLREVL